MGDEVGVVGIEVEEPGVQVPEQSGSESHGSGGPDKMIHVRLSAALHRALRIRVAEEGTTIQEWVERVVSEGVMP